MQKPDAHVASTNDVGSASEVAPHTAGPWRWELNLQSKNLHLVGGRPQYDLTVMDLTRWGMSGARARFRDLSHDGMNLMDNAERWALPIVGREHHATWLQTLSHGDARLIAAAPDLLEALRVLLQEKCDYMRLNSLGDPEIESATKRARAAITKATA